MRFFSRVRCWTSSIRPRTSSRTSRISRGGIHTTGRVPARCSRTSPRQSSRSVLLAPPGISRALAAETSWGVQPAASTSSATQYQFPTVSMATGEPRSTPSRKARRAPGRCTTFFSHTSCPSWLSTRAQV